MSDDAANAGAERDRSADAPRPQRVGKADVIGEVPSPKSQPRAADGGPSAVRRRWKRILIAFCAALVLLFALPKLLDRQPRYQGRTVESWLLQGGDSSRDMAEAKQALDKLGREAMPFIVRALGRRDKSLIGRYLAVRASFPSVLQRVLPAPNDPQNLRWAAMYNLSTNPHSHEFIPEILKLLEDSDPEVRRVTSRLLSEMKPTLDAAALPTLCRALRDDYHRVRSYTTYVISRMGSNALDATPDLARLLDDPVYEVRLAVATVLVGIHGPAFRTKLSTQVVASIEYNLANVTNR